MSAADNLYAELSRGVRHAQVRQHLIDEHRAEVRNEQGPEDCETLAEAADAYRWLRPVIVDTMADSSRWDGDESEEFHLGRYVQWLAAEREQARAEVLREAGAVADELIAAVDRNDPDAFAKVDAFRAYSDRLHEIADGGQAPAGESTPPAGDKGDAVYADAPDDTYATTRGESGDGA